MNTTPTGIDNVAAILGLIILVVSLLTLLGMGALMAIGAVFTRRPLVTSWTPDQEQTFAPYEQRGSSANAQAWAFSLIGAGIVSVIALVLYFGVEPAKSDMTKGMNMSNLTKKRAAPAAKPAEAAPAEAPKPDAPAAPDSK
jgi:hypothetical protein